MVVRRWRPGRVSCSAHARPASWMAGRLGRCPRLRTRVLSTAQVRKGGSARLVRVSRRTGGGGGTAELRRDERVQVWAWLGPEDIHSARGSPERGRGPRRHRRGRAAAVRCARRGEAQWHAGRSTGLGIVSLTGVSRGFRPALRRTLHLACVEDRGGEIVTLPGQPRPMRVHATVEHVNQHAHLHGKE